MEIHGLRSPYETVCGVVYFGRMIDKIRYAALAAKAVQGGEDEALFRSACTHGRIPSFSSVC